MRRGRALDGARWPVGRRRRRLARIAQDILQRGDGFLLGVFGKQAPARAGLFLLVIEFRSGTCSWAATVKAAPSRRTPRLGQILGADGEAADALAGGGEDGVAD